MSDEPRPVASGRAARTPFTLLAATLAVIAAVVVVALVIALVAVVLA